MPYGGVSNENSSLWMLIVNKSCDLDPMHNCKYALVKSILEKKFPLEMFQKYLWPTLLRLILKSAHSRTHLPSCLGTATKGVAQSEFSTGYIIS